MGVRRASLNGARPAESIDPGTHIESAPRQPATPPTSSAQQTEPDSQRRVVQSTVPEQSASSDRPPRSASRRGQRRCLSCGGHVAPDPAPLVAESLATLPPNRTGTAYRFATPPSRHVIRSPFFRGAASIVAPREAGEHPGATAQGHSHSDIVDPRHAFGGTLAFSAASQLAPVAYQSTRGSVPDMYACPMLRCWRFDPLHPLLIPEPNRHGHWRLPLRTDFRCLLRLHSVTLIPIGLAFLPTSQYTLKVTASPSAAGLGLVVDLDVFPRGDGSGVQDIAEVFLPVHYLGSTPLLVTHHSDLFRLTAIPGVEARTLYMY